MKKNPPLSVVILALAFGAAIGMAAGRVGPRPRPNLNAAQKLCAQAYERIDAAQRANEYDPGGHAVRAKDLLDQTIAELKLSLEFSNAEEQAK